MRGLLRTGGKFSSCSFSISGLPPGSKAFSVVISAGFKFVEVSVDPTESPTGIQRFPKELDAGLMISGMTDNNEVLILF